MKAVKKIITATVVSMIISGTGVAFAGNVTVESIAAAEVAALAELTNQSTDTIESKLRSKPAWAIVDEYSVDYDEFMELKASKL